MLKKENIEALLKIDTENNLDNRYLRILSCDNPIKELYVFHLNDVKREYKNMSKEFENKLLFCIYKFNLDLHSYLNGTKAKINTVNCAFKLDNYIVQKAMFEIFEFYSLLESTFNKNRFHEEILDELYSYKISNYIAILQFLNLVDINNDICNSKILSRFHNIKEEIDNYYDDKMNQLILINEFNEHLKYFSKQIEFIKQYKLLEAEDFLIYILLFDIKHNKKTD